MVQKWNCDPNPGTKNTFGTSVFSKSLSLIQSVNFEIRLNVYELQLFLTFKTMNGQCSMIQTIASSKKSCQIDQTPSNSSGKISIRVMGPARSEYCECHNPGLLKPHCDDRNWFKIHSSVNQLFVQPTWTWLYNLLDSLINSRSTVVLSAGTDFSSIGKVKLSRERASNLWQNHHVSLSILFSNGKEITVTTIVSLSRGDRLCLYWYPCGSPKPNFPEKPDFKLFVIRWWKFHT